MVPRDAVLDLDGTVYRGDSLVPGARRGIEALRAAGVEVCFFSNNPTQSAAGFAERLAGLGLDADPDLIRSAATVTADHLVREHPTDRVYLVGSPGLRSILADAGLTLTDDPEACDVFVASYDRRFDYDDMTAGLRALDDETAFVGTDPDITIPTGDGKSVPGSGAVVNAVAGVAERDPDVVVGKPSPEAREAALAALSNPKKWLVVGDRLDTDIALGDVDGATTVLVLSGVTTRADLAASDIEPDYVLDSLGDIGSVLNVDR